MKMQTIIKILGKERELWNTGNGIWYLNQPKDIEELTSYGKTLDEWKSYTIRKEHDNQIIKEHYNFHHKT